jgi:glycosyltransferase involved in cell wall biosynthesis
MKILFLIRSLDIGGAEKQMILLSNGLAERGHDVTVAVFYAGKIDHELSAKVKLNNLHKTGRWGNFQFLKRLYKLSKDLRPDVIHGFLIVPNIFAGLLKIFFPRVRVVWGIRSSNILAGQYTRMDHLTFYLSALLSPLPDLMIANSQSGKNYHQKYYFNKNIVSIANGFDPKKFAPQPDRARILRAKWGVQSDEILIGNVGRLNPIKDHPLFLQTLARLKETELKFKAVCLGSGVAAYRKQLLKLCNDLNLESHIRWLDHHEDMAAAYSAFDLSVLCSKSEGFPNVVMESMACGTPCVVTHSAGDAALIVAQYGAAVESDPKLLAEACYHVLKQKNIWSAEEISGTTLARFNQESLFRRTEELLKTLPS